jgi:hypothetical protein
MTGFEYLPRPYPYGREPFLVASGEKVGFEARFFSIPAFAAQVDKRLFTVSASHPVANVFKLYVNRNSNTTITLEPTISASGYERGTPHYADVILDIRDQLELAWALHAAETDHATEDFRVSHLARQREPYNMSASSRPDVIPGDYTHKESVTLTPSGNELGAKYLQDIDIDEVQWQPFARPKKLGSYTTAALTGFPFEPFFPMALKSDGSLPDFSSLDTTRYGQLGLGAAASGGVLITGDGLLAGTTFKLLDGSGATSVGEGTFNQLVPWALYPAQDKMSLYYERQVSGSVITASGRQAVYNTTTPSDEGVMLLNVAQAGTSGKLVQNWPGNYHATSGIDRNGKAHNGVHVTDGLIYNLYEGSAGNMLQGRSTINGKKVFGHFVGTETNSTGKNWGTASVKHANGNTIFGFGGIITPLTGSPPFFTSVVSWFTTGKTVSPLGWITFSSDVYEPRLGVFGGPNATTWTLGDNNTSSAGTITRKVYTQWGYIDQIVTPDDDVASLGVKTQDPVNYETHIYREGIDPATGLFMWIELPPPQSPIYTTQQVRYFRNTYLCGNIFSLFFLIKPNYGIVHANGNLFVQWSDVVAGVPVKPICNKFAAFGATSTKLVPSTTYSVVGITVGSFPSWSIQLHVTTNNQVTVPDQIAITPASSATITFAAGVPMTLSKVDRFGPVVWDPSAGVNYLYFSTIDIPARVYFAKMNGSFVITQINQVDATDAILSGRAAILDI